MNNGNLPQAGETFGVDGFHVNLKGYTTFVVLKSDYQITEAKLTPTKDPGEQDMVGVRFVFNTHAVKTYLGS